MSHLLTFFDEKKQGSPFDAGFPFPLSEPVMLYCYGDSNIAAAGGTTNTPYVEICRGLPPLLEAYSRGRVKFDANNNFGFGGDTTEDLLIWLQGGTPTNTGNYERKPLFIPTDGCVFLEILTNDFRDSAFNYNTSVDRMTAIINIFKENGNFIFVQNVKPLSDENVDSERMEDVLRMRAWIKTKCKNDYMLKEIDGTTAIANSNFTIKSAYDIGDGLHFNAAGREAQMQYAWNIEGLKDFIGFLPFYSPYNNILVNPKLSGSGGTNSASSYTGIVPTGWTVTQFAKDSSGTSVTAECSYEGYYDSDGDFNIYANIPSASGNGQEYIYITQTLSGWAVGDVLDMRALLQTTEAINAFSASILASITRPNGDNIAINYRYGANGYYAHDFIAVNDEMGAYSSSFYVIPSDATAINIRIIVGVQRRTGLMSKINMKLKSLHVGVPNSTLVNPTTDLLIQNISTSIPAGTKKPATPTTITTINPTMTAVFAYGARPASADTAHSPNHYVSKVTLTSTSLTNETYTNTGGSTSILYSFAGVQLPSEWIESVQRVTVSMTGTQGSSSPVLGAIPIPVSKSRSIAYIQNEVGVTCGSTSQVNIDHIVDISTDGASVEVTASPLIGSSSRNVTVTVIQLRRGIIKNKVNGSISIATSSASGTSSLSSLNGGAGVADGNTLVFPRGLIQGGVSSTNASVAYARTHRSGNTITSTRGVADASTSLTTAFTALELYDGYINVQPKEITIASGGTTGTVALTSVDTSRTFLLRTGTTFSASSTSNEDIFKGIIAIDSSTQASFTRTTAHSSTFVVAIQSVSIL